MNTPEDKEKDDFCVPLVSQKLLMVLSAHTTMGSSFGPHPTLPSTSSYTSKIINSPPGSQQINWEKVVQ